MEKPPEDLLVLWGESVRKTLQTQGRTQIWLARKLGMNSSQLCRMLNGDSRYYFSDQLKWDISRFLGVPVSILFQKGETDD